ncbi:hypothetical protein [Streptomyces sp. S186]|uniref:hypothetical protein n=1 Tax=Streptomyces sp. S186 TaxID=3434395 RepID=UPI003F677AB3
MSAGTRPLVVPLAVDALMANDTTMDPPPERFHQPDFSQLKSHGQPESHSPVTDAFRGVCLQWELPAALRTGRPDPATPGGLRFPHLPNRWLIVRHSFPTLPDTPAPKPEVRAWLIRTGVENKDEANEVDYAAAFLPGAPAEDEGGFPTTVSYGQVIPLDGTGTVPAPKNEIPLTADSSGMPMFVSYQPYNQNILSFHDKKEWLQAVQPPPSALNGNEITVNYLVAGWYTAPATDLLLTTPKERLQTTLDALGWTLPAGTELPDVTGTLYIGAVVGMPWNDKLSVNPYLSPDLDGKGHPIPLDLEGRPSPGEVTPALGHSSVEALTALLRYEGQLDPLEEAMFELVEYNLLDAPPRPSLPDHTLEPAADHALDYTRHDFTFTHHPGSHRWQLAASPVSPPPPAPTKPQINALKDLNTAQDTYDRAARTLTDLTTRLKGLWWITSNPGADEPKKPTGDQCTAMQNLARQIHDCHTTLKDLTGKIPSGNTPEDLAKAVNAWQTQHDINPQQYTLQRAPLPPFRQSGNPVIALGRLLDKKRTPEHDGHLGGPLPVRPTLPPGTDWSPLSQDEQTRLRGDLSPLATIHLPALLHEFHTLAEGARAIVQPHTPTSQTPPRSKATADHLTKLVGPHPYLDWWHQPWKPVLVRWSANLYPTPATGATSHYEFTDAQGTTPARYTHKKNVKKITDRAKCRKLSGYGFLLPLLAAHTRYRLQHAQSVLTPESEAYKVCSRLVDKLHKHEAETLNALSFTLVGLNETLANRKNDIPLRTRSVQAPDGTDDLTYDPEPADGYFTPEPPVLTANIPHLPLDAQNIVGDAASDKAALGDGIFPPARAAQVQLTGLTIIDTYGRTHTRVADYGVWTDSMQVHPDTISYEGIPNPTTQADLSPRLHQGGRLRFDYLDSPTGTPLPELPIAQTGNPVHGWLLPTRFGDRLSLLCYTPEGKPLFDLHYLAKDPTHARIRPLPHSRYQTPHDDGFKEAHRQLASFLIPLSPSQSTTPANDLSPLAELFHSLDKSLARITPPSPQGPDSRPLALLIGRPCALVTTRLRLELDGPPLPDTTPKALADGGPAPTASWPVRLGDPRLTNDGVLGYFLPHDTTWRHFRTPDPYAGGSYTQPINNDTDITLTPQDPTGNSPTDTHITLLVTPHNPITAITDILPVTQLTLPHALIDQALSTIEPALPLGPVLIPPAPTPKTPTLPTAPPAPLAMLTPLLGTDHGTWAWTQPAPPTTPGSPPTTPDWEDHPLTPPPPTDQAPGPLPHAHTGYLQLKPTPPKTPDHPRPPTPTHGRT